MFSIPLHYTTTIRVNYQDFISDSNSFFHNHNTTIDINHIHSFQYFVHIIKL
jgi:hypothetical protein